MLFGFARERQLGALFVKSIDHLYIIQSRADVLTGALPLRSVEGSDPYNAGGRDASADGGVSGFDTAGVVAGGGFHMKSGAWW